MTSPGAKPERRRYPRALTSFSAVLTAGQQTYTARVINLSMGGALLAFANDTAAPSIHVKDRLSLKIRCRGGAGPLTLDGTAVLWNVKSGIVPLLAVQFDEVNGENAEILEDLLFEALSAQGPHSAIGILP